MTIRHLQIFEAVCDCGSITGAAQRLNVTQPSVSIAIKELESFYGVRLFDRLNRRIYLTDAGETLRGYSDALLGQFDEATQVLREGFMPLKCAVGVNVSVAETYFADIAKKLNTQLPELNLSVTVQNNEQLDRLLTENKIDLAIFDSAANRASRSLIPLFDDEMAVVCAPSLYSKDSISIAELAKKPLLLREKGSGVRYCVDACFSQYGCNAEIAAESISTLSLLRFAERGMGFAIVPGLLAESFGGKALKTVAVSDAQFKRYFFLVYNSKKHITPGMSKVMELMTEE